jgi:hypothetical protein
VFDFFCSICLGTDRSSTTALIEDVKREFGGKGSDGDERRDGIDRMPVLVSTLNPSDCTSMISTMKALINGFLDSVDESEDDDDTEEIGFRPAPYDIALLEPWYRRIKQRKGKPNTQPVFVLSSC